MPLDIISYGEANKASRLSKSTEAKMGADVKNYFDNSKTFGSVKERVDALTEKVTSHYKLTDDLAFQNALNIIKSNQKLNLVEQLLRVNGDSMVFDDLADLSGIDLAQSSDYTHKASEHWITSTNDQCVITTVPETVDATKRHLIFIVDGETGVEGYVTHDDTSSGADPTWHPLNKSEGVFIFKLSEITHSTIQFRFVIPEGKRLFYYGWVIA